MSDHTRIFRDPPPACDECGAEVVLPSPCDLEKTLLTPESRLRCSQDAEHEHGCRMAAEVGA